MIVGEHKKSSLTLLVYSTTVAILLVGYRYAVVSRFDYQLFRRNPDDDEMLLQYLTPH